MIFDKIGQEIKPGSYIVYGHALGRCAGLRIGKVIKIDEFKENRWGRIGCRISVRGVNDDWKHDPIKLTQKLGTLLFPNRIVVLAPELVPQDYRDLLDS